MKTAFAFAAIAALAAAVTIEGQSPAPYKLGMFEQNGRQFAGMVIQNDTLEGGERRRVHLWIHAR